MKGSWVEKIPVYCECCDVHLEYIGNYFIDGKIKSSTKWGILCEDCHKKYGIGLGMGKGQKYDLRTGEKVAG